MDDMVKAPAHYRGDGEVDCKRSVRSMMSPADVSPLVGYWWGCTFKYLWRWPMKHKQRDMIEQDIDKCIESLQNMKEAYLDDL